MPGISKTTSNGQMPQVNNTFAESLENKLPLADAASRFDCYQVTSVVQRLRT
jgi:hypothetical protein